MSNTVNVVIGKKNSGSNLTDGNIAYLKNKISTLNNIYNIIFTNLCYKKNINMSHDLLSNVKAELNTQIGDYQNDFCLGSTIPAITSKTHIEILRDDIKTKYNGVSNKASPDHTQLENLTNSAKVYIMEIEKDLSYRLRITESQIMVALSKLVFDSTTHKVDTTHATFNSGSALTTEAKYIVTVCDNFITNIASDPFPKASNKKTCSTESMFDDAKLSHLINSMYVDSLLNKVCLYRNIKNTATANVQIAGAHNNDQQLNLIDIVKILKEKNKQSANFESYDQTQDKDQYQHQLNMICVQHNNKLKCANIKLNNRQSGQSKLLKQRNCVFCEKWIRDRNMFKSVLKDLLIVEDMNQSLELMNSSVHLLPSAILDQNQYESFFTALNEYKKNYKSKFN
jgi:hypothetical protein